MCAILPGFKHLNNQSGVMRVIESSVSFMLVCVKEHSPEQDLRWLSPDANDALRCCFTLTKAT